MMISPGNGPRRLIFPPEAPTPLSAGLLRSLLPPNTPINRRYFLREVPILRVLVHHLIALGREFPPRPKNQDQKLGGPPGRASFWVASQRSPVAAPGSEGRSGGIGEAPFRQRELIHLASISSPEFPLALWIRAVRRHREVFPQVVWPLHTRKTCDRFRGLRVGSSHQFAATADLDPGVEHSAS
jgi:hypothetical protein